VCLVRLLRYQSVFLARIALPSAFQMLRRYSLLL
jgi:hypothetical protein